MTERDALVRSIKRCEELDYWFPSEKSGTASHEVGTFNGLANSWLEHAEKVREISQSCLGNYKCHLKHHILPILGDIFLKDLSLKSIEKVAVVI